MSGAPGVNLLVTGVVVFSLIILKVALYSPIYEKLSIEFLETTCYVNLILLFFASFYTLEAKKDQTVAAYISGGNWKRWNWKMEMETEMEKDVENGKGRGKWKGSSVRFYFQRYEVVQTITWHLS